ncbi:YitT family protein [Clostridium sp.]|uniref:YitT family protein n=1 Tax=Clostridium sp. TaxID=1506 RepID=UPI003F29FF9F
MTKDKIVDTAKEYLIITFGVILVSFGIQYFYAPNDLAAGGLSGLALVINNYIPALSVGVTIFLGNLILFIISFILIGKEFGFKTIYASFMLSVVIEFMEKVLHSYALTTNLILAVIFGTLFVAVGLAIVFLRNSSTGGTDILAKILNKYSTFNIGISLLCVDLLVTIAGALTFGLDKGIYSLIAISINGILIDKFILIMSSKKEKEETVTLEGAIE